MHSRKAQIKEEKFSLHFDESFPSGIYQTWKWKIDPWCRNNDAAENEKSVVRISSVSPLARKMLVDNADKEIGLALPMIFAGRSGFFEQRVFHLSDGGTRWDYVRLQGNQLQLRFKVNRDWDHIVLLEDHTGTNGTAAFEYLAQIMPGVCLEKQMLTFHAAFLEYNNKGKRYGIGICAPSGTGKTTHARLWRDNKEALILNGDRLICSPSVFSDMNEQNQNRDFSRHWIGYGSPWSGTSGEQINRSVPLRALVVLERGDHNETTHLSGLKAFGAVLPHVLYPSWDREKAEQAIDLLTQFLTDIPVIRLRCLPDVESVDVLFRALENL